MDFLYNKKRIFIFISMICFFVGVHIVQGATLSVVSTESVVLPQAQIKVDVVVDSGSESINAVQGELAYDATLLRVDRIDTGDSIISFWVEEPNVVSSKDTISFAGIVPAGIVTPKGYLFSIIFTAQKEGSATITIKNREVLQNDGNGTKLSTNVIPSNIMITKESTTKPASYEIIDTVAPEKFTITRTRDEHLFDGKWFAVFHSQDKGAGIARYVICESLFKKCVPAESPQLLTHQSNFYHLVVKAYDNNNNVRYALLISKKTVFLYAGIVGLVILSWYGLRSRKKYKKVSI